MKQVGGRQKNIKTKKKKEKFSITVSLKDKGKK